MSDFDGAAPPLPRRRGCRFSCRTLLLIVAAVAVCLGIGVRPWQRHRVLQTIRRELGGGVLYSYEYRPTEHGWSNSVEAGPGPTWLRQSLGEPLFDDLFCDVAGVIVGDFTIHAGRPTPPKDVRSPVDDTHLKWLR